MTKSLNLKSRFGGVDDQMTKSFDLPLYSYLVAGQKSRFVGVDEIKCDESNHPDKSGRFGVVDD